MPQELFLNELLAQTRDISASPSVSDDAYRVKCSSPSLRSNCAPYTFLDHSLCDTYQRRSRHLIVTIDRVVENSEAIVGGGISTTLDVVLIVAFQRGLRRDCRLDPTIGSYPTLADELLERRIPPRVWAGCLDQDCE